jgi:hypothetical protein
MTTEALEHWEPRALGTVTYTFLNNENTCGARSTVFLTFCGWRPKNGHTRPGRGQFSYHARLSGLMFGPQSRPVARKVPWANSRWLRELQVFQGGGGGRHDLC